MNLRKIVVNFDYTLLLTSIILSVVGIAFIYSANINKNEHLKIEYLKQIIFALAGLAVLISVLFMNMRTMKSSVEIFYIICFIGLFLTLFFPSVKGQRRFSLFGVSIQFAEFMKIAVTFYLSKFYSSNYVNIKSLTIYLKGSLIAFIPVGAIMLQPDLGSSLVFIPIILAISFVAGIRKRYLLYTVLFFFTVGFIPIITTVNSLFFKNENEIIYLMTNMKYVILVFIFLFITIAISILAYLDIIKGISNKFKLLFYWFVFFASIAFFGLLLSYPVNKFVLKGYQKDRLLIFFNPYSDPMNSGYNIIQAMTAIGNGGFSGKGWQKGEMIQNLFVPEQSTDFIFPVIAEELGFLGTVLIVFLYGLFFFRGFYIAINCKDLWSSCVTAGLLSYLLFHILQNIGMCIGIMPVTGIPLPFISYGGTFIVSCFLTTGLLLNFHINRFQY
ncbi:MAG TPA: hypothetical protein DC057_05135 [Spirochaetia bacterium]|nr:hypothetical protein [Spirochaetia bacterium]